MRDLDKSRKRTKIVKYAFLISGLSILVFIFISLPSDNLEIPKQDEMALNQDMNLEKTTEDNFDFKINQPIFEGLSSDLLPYKLIAQKATKIGNNLYNLQFVNAKYTLENGNLKIIAKQGFINDEIKSMRLQNDVRVNYDELEIISDEMLFNMYDKKIQSNSKIHVIYKNSTIDADKFDTTNLSEIMNLEGNVESNFKISDF